MSDRETEAESGSRPLEARRLLRLRRILERRIVPSLALPPDSVLAATGPHPDREDQSDALVALALQGQEAQARDEISALSGAGMSFDDLQLGLLAPAAEKLGILWEQDRLSFVDVTIAMGTLHRLMQFVALDLSSPRVLGLRPRSILMFPEPGAQHTFGADMAARFFRRWGWEVEFVPDPDPDLLCRLVAHRHFDVLGLSQTRDLQTAASARLIRTLREETRNPRAVVIAGGSSLVRNPILLGELGADAAVVAISSARTQISRLLEPPRDPMTDP